MFGKAEQFDDITMLELFYKKKKRVNKMKVEKEFNADIKQLSEIQNFVELELGNCNCDKKTMTQLNLVTEEIFVNIANYA